MGVASGPLRMDGYARFDEFEDVVVSVELVALLARLLDEHPSYWMKWRRCTSSMGSSPELTNTTVCCGYIARGSRSDQRSSRSYAGDCLIRAYPHRRARPPRPRHRRSVSRLHLCEASQEGEEFNRREHDDPSDCGSVLLSI